MSASKQKEKLINLIITTTRIKAEEVVNELSVKGVLTSENLPGVIAQDDKVLEAIDVAVRTILFQLVNNLVIRLKRLYSTTKIVIPATDGRDTLWGAKSVFGSGICGVQKQLSIGGATKETTVAIYRVVEG